MQPDLHPGQCCHCGVSEDVKPALKRNSGIIQITASSSYRLGSRPDEWREFPAGQ